MRGIIGQAYGFQWETVTPPTLPPDYMLETYIKPAIQNLMSDVDASILLAYQNAPLAQSAERLFRKERVGGSIPSRSSI
jgi:hypothetical protein